MGRPKGCNKDKRDSGRFITLPVCVLDSPAYLTASPHARMLLLDLAVQYRGNNNGDLAATWGAMRKRGWRSKDTLHRALQELLAHNLICEARKGSRPRKPTLYAVLWLSLDECGGKLDMSNVAYAKLRGTYQQFKTPAKLPTNFDGNGCKVLTPPTRPKSPAHRAIRHPEGGECAPPTGPVEPKIGISVPRQPGSSIDIPGSTPLSGGAPVPVPGTVMSSGAVALPSARIVIAMLAAGWLATADAEPPTSPSRQIAVELAYEPADEPIPDYDCREANL